ncbi:hypothetical protein BMI91_19620 [Thioclava sediminum]|uniref:HK97 gp10 family phage protein n=1 Tax=Thioclava sediminum TaxID=1915319 RepID=A0ABX3MS95_9RHOB|nr:hypothetical protein [Thioclava sediminum]OOY22493.1 hypothetical protein BMI91_19620 [Thioclava sediminum]
MAMHGWDARRFVKEFEREELNARKRAGRKIGAEVKREGKKALGKVSSARKKRITAKVAKNATLVVKDTGADARVREYGATIKPEKSQFLRVNFGPENRDVNGTFTADVNGKKLLFTGHGKTARPIAVLKKVVRRFAVSSNKKLSHILESKLDKYADLYEEELTNGK